MKLFRLSTCGFLIGLSALAAERSWLIGKVLDTAASRTVTASGTSSAYHTDENATAYTSGTATRDLSGTSTIGAATTANGTSNTYGGTRLHHEIIQDEQTVIQGGDYIYIANDITLKAAGSKLHGSLGRANRGSRRTTAAEASRVANLPKVAAEIEKLITPITRKHPMNPSGA